MITESSTSQEVIAELKQTTDEIVRLIRELPEEKLNIVPYADSWTAGQLVRHVTKSLKGIGETMPLKGRPADRDTTLRAKELSDIFLDFSTKMQSPDFIISEDMTYVKNDSIREIEDAFETTRVSSNNADLSELMDDTPFGAVTKVELLHFALYHTQRHQNQLKRITTELDKKA